MALFWRRKKKDDIITLGLNEPRTTTPAAQTEIDAAAATPLETNQESRQRLEPPAAGSASAALTPPAIIAPPALEPVTTGSAPSSTPQNQMSEAANSLAGTTRNAQTETNARTESAAPLPEAPRPQPPVVPSRSPFTTSILGLDRSIEELQAEEAALEAAFAARFRRAVSATRESLSEKIDTVFQNRKQIDAELLDDLEEASTLR